jgi:exo-beta-1,3-glucanase (GH17 family)
MKTSYPPSAGAFKQDLMQHITEILEFHVQTGSPFCVNIYPYFAYKANPQKIPLAYVVFEPNSGFVDPNTGVQYDNMFLAQIDAVYSALSLLGYEELSVCVAETGWPSKGDADEAGATIDNAAKYNGNLMKMNINDEVDVYIFALFNENMKPGPTSERNFGLFKPDTSPVYSVDGHTTDELSASLSAIKRFRLILFLCLASTALL